MRHQWRQAESSKKLWRTQGRRGLHRAWLVGPSGVVDVLSLMHLLHARMSSGSKDEYALR